MTQNQSEIDEQRAQIQAEQILLDQHLAVLCSNVAVLKALAAQVKPTTDPIQLTLGAAVSFAIGHVGQAVRKMLVAELEKEVQRPGPTSAGNN